MITVRPELPSDRAAIGRVVTAAFESDAEAILIERIRASDRFIPELSLVAVTEDEIVGHVMISFADLDDEGTRHRVAIMAPVAVHPEAQRRGIGRSLVRAALEQAESLGEPMVVLEGSPRYYGALGFEHSVPHGIRIDLPDWAPPAAAQVYRLSGYDPSIRGRLVLPEAFEGLD